MIVEAQKVDAERLCEIAVSAFIEDTKYRPDTVLVNGPPGHDNVDVHRQWMKDHHYVKYVRGSDIVAGGVVNFETECAEIHGLFVDSDMMNRGIGKELIQYLFERHPKIKTWQLETPDYAIRNQAFYERLGFICIQKTEVEANLGFGFYKYRAQIDG